jgi:hypothetical protein
MSVESYHNKDLENEYKSEKPVKQIVHPFLTEMAKHEGWIENLRNEERSMKDSIKKCIDGGYTRDPERARQILKFAFPES